MRAIDAARDENGFADFSDFCQETQNVFSRLIGTFNHDPSLCRSALGRKGRNPGNGGAMGKKWSFPSSADALCGNCAYNQLP